MVIEVRARATTLLPQVRFVCIVESQIYADWALRAGKIFRTARRRSLPLRENPGDATLVVTRDVKVCKDTDRFPASSRGSAYSVAKCTESARGPSLQGLDKPHLPTTRACRGAPARNPGKSPSPR